MSDAPNNKIMGFIPKAEYVKYTYYLLLGATAGGALLSLLALIGIYIPLGQLCQLAMVIGLIMALLGCFVFRPEFSGLDQSHLVYIAVVIGVLFLVGLILSSAVAILVILVHLVTLLIVLAQLVAAWTGYNSWSRGRTITKDNIQSEVQAALKRQ
jgi:hypothetical protein